MRACALEMHFNISQEPLYTEIHGENAAPQKLGPNFARACHFLRKLKGKMPQAKPADHTLCERAQSKCTSTCHKSHSTLYGNLQVKCRRPNPRTTLCASLRSRNACQHFTRATFYSEIYRKNARDQSEHPDQAPAFTPTVRTPQCGHTVWGNKPSIWEYFIPSIYGDLGNGLLLFYSH